MRAREEKEPILIELRLSRGNGSQKKERKKDERVERERDKEEQGSHLFHPIVQ